MAEQFIISVPEGQLPALDIPSWVFWQRWQESGRDLPLVGDCPRCGEAMIGGFWMHLCPDNRKVT